MEIQKQRDKYNDIHMFVVISICQGYTPVCIFIWNLQPLSNPKGMYMVGSGSLFLFVWEGGVKHERTCFLACSSCHTSGQQWRSTTCPSCYLSYFLNHKISGLLTKKSQLLPKHIFKKQKMKKKKSNRFNPWKKKRKKKENTISVEQKRERLIWWLN